MPKALRIASATDDLESSSSIEAYAEQSGSWTGLEVAKTSRRSTGGARASAKEPNSIQAVSRTLSLLRELNLNNGATILALAAAVNLPRGTVYRMMENLKALGYVRKDPHTRGYWIERVCQELGGGFVDQSWVLDVGNRVVNRLYGETNLGVVLTTPQREVMSVRISTMLRNSAGGHRTTAGTQILIGQSCSGHAYLAHCSRDLRQHLLDEFYRRGEREPGHAPFMHNHVPLTRILAEKLLDGINRQGYATGHAFADRSGRLGVVAVPIIRGGQAAGTLSLNFFYSSLKTTALSFHLGLLKRAAQDVGASTTLS